MNTDALELIGVHTAHSNYLFGALPFRLQFRKGNRHRKSRTFQSSKSLGDFRRMPPGLGFMVRLAALALPIVHSIQRLKLADRPCLNERVERNERG